MTLGLAVSTDQYIALAVESMGVPCVGSHPSTLGLMTKLLLLQSDPEVVALAPGGLDDWYEVARHYSPQRSVTAAAESIKQILDHCMTKNNQAFGLVCGFDAEKAICYRINRSLNTDSATVDAEDLRKIPRLGAENLSDVAQKHAL